MLWSGSRTAISAVLAAALLAACASQGQDGGSPQSTAATGDAESSSATSSVSANGTTDSTIDLVLAEEITSLGGANGEDPSCTDEAAVFVDPGEAGVWLLQGPEADETVTMPHAIRLCLAGFTPGTVTVDAKVGAETYRTSVILSDAGTDASFAEDPSMLFVDGATITMTMLDGDVSHSDGWTFVPPPAVRDTLAREGSVTLTATQGSLTATRTQSVEPADVPYRYWLNFGPPLLLVYGFEEGARIPVGLYRYTGSGENSFESPFSLVRQIAVVTMPASRVVVFEVPADVLDEAAAGDVRHCVTVPLGGDEESNCPEL